MHAPDAQASMSAMEEEKLELANEIKRLQERLQRQAKGPDGDKGSKYESDKRSIERAEDMKKVLEGERAALDEDKATLEKERRHLIILKGQLDRQQVPSSSITPISNFPIPPCLTSHTNRLLQPASIIHEAQY